MTTEQETEKSKAMLTLSSKLMGQVDARSDKQGRGFARSERIETDLSIYYYLLEKARWEIAETFDGPELWLMCDSLNGAVETPTLVNFASLNMQDSVMAEGLAEKWSVDPELLLDKVGKLTLPQKAALVDAIAQYWIALGNGKTVNAANLLR